MIKLVADTKARVFVENIPVGIKKHGKRHVALYGGRILRRIKEDIRGWAKDRSGELENSFEIKLRDNGGDFVDMKIESDAPHAGIQHHGGTITPKRTKYLTIPLTPTARQHRARYFPGVLSPIATKSGKLMLARTLPGGDIEPQYLLVRSVTISPKWYLSRAMERSVGDGEKTFKEFAIAVTEFARDMTTRTAKK